MSRYLARLKSEKRATNELQKVQKGVFTVFAVPSIGTFEKINPSPDTPRPDPLPPYQQQLSDEAERRADFCNLHRAMLGDCRHLDGIERRQRGDQAGALDGCLLWQLVRAGDRIENAAQAEIVPGITVADVLRWVGKDVEAVKKERRLLLTCAESMATRH